MPALTLYGTSCCHLCEQAEVILREIGVVAKHIDIADDDGLVEKYGVRIPVLRRIDNGVRIPRDSATDSTVIRPPAPRASGRVSRSEATQGFQVKVLSCLLSIFLFPCAWFFRSN